MIGRYRHIILLAMAAVIPFWIKGIVMDVLLSPPFTVLTRQ